MVCWERLGASQTHGVDSGIQFPNPMLVRVQRCKRVRDSELHKLGCAVGGGFQLLDVAQLAVKVGDQASAAGGLHADVCSTVNGETKDIPNWSGKGIIRL